jgi:uncharacterized protein YhaN
MVIKGLCRYLGRFTNNIARDQEYRSLVPARGEIIMDSTEPSVTGNSKAREITVAQRQRGRGSNVLHHTDTPSPEAGNADFTREKLNRNTQKMFQLQNIWVKASRSFNNTAAPKKKSGKPPSFASGLPTQSYTTYHAETVSLLAPVYQDYETSIKDFSERRWRKCRRKTTEKSRMVETKAGNTLENMAERMVAPRQEEIEDLMFREDEVEKGIDRGEEGNDDEVLRGARRNVGLERCGGRQWWRGE